METATVEKPKQKRHTARRGNGEGGIYQRSDGRWCASVTVGYSDSGKRRRKTVYGWTKGDVQAKLTKLLAQKQDGTLADGKRVTVGAYLEQWLENSVRLNRRASTYTSYRQIADNHILPYIGGLQLARLSPANMSALHSTLRDEGKSPRIVQMAHVVMRRALHVAMRAGSVVRNVCDAVERPQAARHEITPLTIEQAQGLLLAMEQHRLHALMILAITSGLRQGELFALRWEDVELTAGTISVRRTVVQIKEEFIINEPKTAKGRRKVEIPPMAVDALRLHRARMLKEGFAGDERIFVSRTGKYLRRNSVRKTFIAILKAAGLPIVRFHDMRHTCATLLLSTGTHPKVVQERLGHGTIGVTMDTYSHVLPTMQLAASDKLGALLQSKVS